MDSQSPWSSLCALGQDQQPGSVSISSTSWKRAAVTCFDSTLFQVELHILEAEAFCRSKLGA